MQANNKLTQSFFSVLNPLILGNCFGIRHVYITLNTCQYLLYLIAKFKTHTFWQYTPDKAISILWVPIHKYCLQEGESCINE